MNTPVRSTKDHNFLLSAKNALSPYEFLVLSDIIDEWHEAQTLSSCLKHWSSTVKQSTLSSLSFLHTLYFNVRGLDCRWNEVLHISSKYQFDILVLGEVGKVDQTLLGASLPSYRSCYQAGENSHGGVIILIREGLPFSRINCSIPNVCIVDFHLDSPCRLIGLYAPASKSWSWNDLSSLITTTTVMLGDFNVDLDKDSDKASSLLTWADHMGLAPYTPKDNTSLRSDRTIDYSLATGIEVSIQTLGEPTTSDHKPINCIISCEHNKENVISSTLWNVFSLFLSYAYDFWEQQWSIDKLNSVYDAFVKWLVAVAGRCTKFFPKKMARLSIPPDLKELLAHCRSLAFKASRKGCIKLRDEARRLRNIARYKLKQFQREQLIKTLNNRHMSGSGSLQFWSRTKKHFRSSSSILRGFIHPNGEVTKDPQQMTNLAANHYEKLFDEPTVYRPHPYVDTEIPDFNNQSVTIPTVTYPEVLKVLVGRTKKRSLDCHGLSPLLIGKMPKNYWHLLIKLYNHSFSTCFLPSRFKDVKMILLAKNNSICTPELTRPIALLDSFLKVQERLFLNRFRQILNNLGILPDSQSGFRPGHRLQTRVLLLVEQISSYMANSSPVTTVFVDFKSAFDQIWFEGCLGKLLRMGIPVAYVNWIRSWLMDRRCTIEIQGKRSRWFQIKRGGPQGSCFTPTLFITYHADMGDFLPVALSFFFADDLAAVMAGQIGIRYTDQCIDLERRLSIFFEHLEYYATLAVQPINYSKTQAMWSARAVGYPNPMPILKCGGQEIKWVNSYKYLGYMITTKLGWGAVIGRTLMKVRQQSAIINSIRYNGASSRMLRRILFSTFIIPFFTWVHALYPLFTELQRTNLNHFYYTVLKRLLKCTHWNDLFFAYAFDERSLDDICYSYWTKYKKKLAKSLDGFLLIEQLCLNSHRVAWQEGNHPIRGLYRSKRFVHHADVFSRALDWMIGHGSADSVVIFDKEDIRCLAYFPETF